MKNLFVFFIITILNVTNSFAQKQFNNWYCNGQTALTFNTPDGKPKLLYDNKMYSGAPASISDANGNLLFYTDGVTVWNRNHEVMENGEGLFGDPTPTDHFDHQTLITPMPGKIGVFYIFTTGRSYIQVEVIDGYKETIIGFDRGLNYSIIDITKNNGLGSVINKNVLLSSNISGQVNGVLHKNGKDIWVIVPNRTGSVFSSYLLTESGIESASTSNFNTILPDNYYSYVPFCSLVKSLDGKRIVSAFTGLWDPEHFPKNDFRGFIPSYFEIYDFNNETGKLENRKYFLEFYKSLALGGIDIDDFIRTTNIKLSPDGSKIYLTLVADLGSNLDEKSCIIQFDLNQDSTSMINNCIILEKGMEYQFSRNMQIGPDKKLYYYDLLKPDYFSVIKKPNEKGINCDIQKQILPIVSGYYTSIFPNDVFYSSFITVKPEGDTICYGENLEIKGNAISAMPLEKVIWEGPNGFSSNDTNIYFPNATPQINGWYKITAISNGDTATDSVYVLVHTKNPDTIRIIPSDSVALCRYGSLTLEIDTPRDDYKYYWSTGDTTSFIIVDKPGRYIAVVIDSNGCEQIDSVNVFIKDLEPEIEIIGNIPACDGDTVILRTKEKYETYTWSTGDSTWEIKLTKSTRCHVEVIDSNGCYGITDEVEVLFYSKPKTLLKGLDTVCLGSNQKYYINKVTKDTVLWNVQGGNLISNIGTDTIVVNWNKPGLGKIIVTQVNSKGCNGFDTIDVVVIDDVKPTILPKKPVICSNNPLALTTELDYLTYEWSTGETTKEISIVNAGQYFVKVTTAGGCEGWDTVNVIQGEEPVPVIIGNFSFCSGQSTILSTSKQYTKYLWNTGDTTQSINVNTAGNYFVEVTDSNGCKGFASVDVTEMKIDISGLSDINFGRINIDNQDEKTIILTNKSNGKIKIENIYLKNSGAEISIETIPKTPVILDSGSIISVKIDFKPDYMQAYSDSLIVEIIEPCKEIFKSNISGDGISKLTVWLPDIKAEVDADICIPLTGKLQTQSDVKLDTKFDAEVAYNASAFYTINQIVTGALEANYLINNHSLNIGRDTAIIQDICGNILLPLEKTSDLKINSFILANQYCDVEIINGSITIDACAFKISHIISSEKLEITLTPNPAEDEITIKYRSSNNGIMQMKVYNPLGLEVENFQWNKLEISGEYICDVSNLVNGIYFYQVVENDGIVARGRFIVNK